MHETLVNFINERYNIYLRRKSGERWPWTEDAILRTYRFTNVFREDDPVTIFVKKWLLPWTHHTNFLIGAAAARIFNEPATLTAIGFPEVWEPEKTLDRLNRIAGRTFNPAYIFSTNGIKMDKKEYAIRVLNDVGKLRYKPTQLFAWSITAQYLQSVKGIGSFLSGQIVADMKNIGLNPQAPDRYTFVVPGPGSLRGLTWALGRKFSPSNFNMELNTLQTQVTPHLSEAIRDRGLDAQNFQNCLCEFDKYMRTLEGKGKPKQIYHHRNPVY